MGVLVDLVGPVVAGAAIGVGLLRRGVLVVWLLGALMGLLRGLTVLGTLCLGTLCLGS